MTRGALDVDDLLKVLLVLAIIWLALAILEEFVSVLLSPLELLGPLEPIVGLAIVVLIVLYLLDRI